MSKKLPSIFLSVFFILAVLLLFNTDTYSAPPTLLPGVYIQSASGNLDVSHWSIPVVNDWDNDGKKDLLVGRAKGYLTSPYSTAADTGIVYFYKNTGTDASPLFSTPSKVRACNDTCDLNVGEVY